MFTILRTNLPLINTTTSFLTPKKYYQIILDKKKKNTTTSFSICVNSKLNRGFILKQFFLATIILV
jgi:hypothetical protein